MVNKHKIEFKTSRKENIVIWIEVLIYTIWFWQSPTSFFVLFHLNLINIRGNAQAPNNGLAGYVT